MANRDVTIRIRGKDDTKGAFGSVVRGLNRVKGVIFSLHGALGGLAIGATVRKSLDLFAQQQQAESGIAKALELRGDLTEQNIAMLKQEASALQSITTLGDESALAIMRNGLNMGLAVSKADDLALASANLAAALGKDVNSAAQQITKTLGGYAGELGEVLPEVKGLTAEQLKQGKVIDLINAKYKGFAEQQRQTFGGEIQALNNAVGDSFELLGQRISRALGGDALGQLVETIDDINRVLGFIDSNRPAGRGGTGITLDGLLSGFVDVFDPSFRVGGQSIRDLRGRQLEALAQESFGVESARRNERAAKEIEALAIRAATGKLPESPNLLKLPEGFSPGENFVAVFDAMAKQGAFNNELRTQLQKDGPKIAQSVAGFLSKAIDAGAGQLDRLGSAAEQGAARAMFDRVINARRNRRATPEDDILAAIADQRIGNRPGVSGLSSGGQSSFLTGVAERSRDAAARAIQEAKKQRDDIIAELKRITTNTANIGAGDAVTVLEPFA